MITFPTSIHLESNGTRTLNIRGRSKSNAGLDTRAALTHPIDSCTARSARPAREVVPSKFGGPSLRPDFPRKPCHPLPWLGDPVWFPAQTIHHLSSIASGRPPGLVSRDYDDVIDSRYIINLPAQLAPSHAETASDETDLRDDSFCWDGFH